jgi:nucleoside-diphosphate-sugar epimerase
MRVLLTGGSGNLGQALVPRLLDRGDTPVILDVRAPRSLNDGAVFIETSILDRSKLTEIFRGCDGIVHIAAWHGIHEDRGEKDAYDFFDLNVRGTFEVFEAAAAAGISKVIYISTTSVHRPDTRYGSSKVLAEQIAEDYRKHRRMNVVTLRPRGFIPYWDRAVYAKYSDWARWFWKGIAWPIAQGSRAGAFIVPIPGAKSRKHLEENVRADDIVLTVDDLAEIDRIVPPGAASGTRYPIGQMHRLNL